MSIEELKKQVVDNDLCTRCGACVGICPLKCIDYTSSNDFTPKATGVNCVDCKKCNRVCPGLGYDINNRRDGLLYNDLIGSYNGLYTGASTDEIILSNCSSGGIITALLVYLFEYGLIEEALVVVNNIDAKDGFSKGILAKSSKEVLRAAQSKYANVATLDVVRSAKQNDKKMAIVGLPCQIAAFSKMCETDPKLRDKTVIKIGMFCGYTYTSDCYDYLFRYMNIDRKDVKAIKGWRDNGVPGGFAVTLNNGETKQISFQEEHALDTVLFAQNRCLLCEDCFSEYADLVVGDTGHFAYKDSLIISRTLEGKQLLSACEQANKIVLTERSIEYALKKTVIPFMHREKREKVAERIRLYKKDSMPVPSWNLIVRNSGISNRIVVFKQYQARKRKGYILKNSKRHYRLGKYLYLGLENTIFIRGLRKIERLINNGKNKL